MKRLIIFLMCAGTISGHLNADDETAKGIFGGALGGAALGGIIGGGRGAGIGALTGAVVGGSIGAARENQKSRSYYYDENGREYSVRRGNRYYTRTVSNQNEVQQNSSPRTKRQRQVAQEIYEQDEGEEPGE